MCVRTVRPWTSSTAIFLAPTILQRFMLCVCLCDVCTHSVPLNLSLDPENSFVMDVKLPDQKATMNSVTAIIQVCVWMYSVCSV